MPKLPDAFGSYEEDWLTSTETDELRSLCATLPYKAYTFGRTPVLWFGTGVGNDRNRARDGESLYSAHQRWNLWETMLWVSIDGDKHQTG
jgi:hypothetical protein